MSQTDAIKNIAARADALGKPIHILCREAGLAPSTFYRWRKGAKAGFDNLLAVQRRLSELERSGGVNGPDPGASGIRPVNQAKDL